MTTKTIPANLEDEGRKHADTQLRMEEEGEKLAPAARKKLRWGRKTTYEILQGGVTAKGFTLGRASVFEVHIDDPFTAKTTSWANAR